MNQFVQQEKEKDIIPEFHGIGDGVPSRTKQPSLSLSDLQNTIYQLSDKVCDIISFLSDAKNGATAILRDIENIGEELGRYEESVNSNNNQSSETVRHQASTPKPAEDMTQSTLQEKYAHVCEANSILENKIRYYQKDEAYKNNHIAELEKRISELEYLLYQQNSDIQRHSWEKEKQQGTDRNSLSDR